MDSPPQSANLKFGHKIKHRQEPLDPGYRINHKEDI